jgi:hypothetical protein
MPPTSAGSSRSRRSIRLHDLLAHPGVHVLLDRDAGRLDVLRPGRLVTVHRLGSVPGRGLAVVRPDGYIGFRSGTADVGQLTTWLARVSAADLPGARSRA